MRSSAFVIFASMFSLSVSSGAPPATKEPSYSSEKPSHAKVILDEAGTKILILAFDESQGTGKGYDTIYADLNLNGDLTDEKPIAGRLQRQGRSNMSCSFPPIAVNVPYNDKGKGVGTPWQLTFTYNKFTQARLFGFIRGLTQEMLFLDGSIGLKDENSEWRYFFWSPVGRTGTAALGGELGTIAFRGNPMLFVETKPDPQKKGNTGIAATLRCGTHIFRCTKVGQPVKAHVLVNDEQGNSVHSEDVDLGRMFFG